MRKLLVLIISVLFSVANVIAQPVADGGTMESNGKIYVVMAVCLTILAGLFFYIISIDRKISKIEKKND